MIFYVPPNLVDDYKAFLQTNVCQDAYFCHDTSAIDPEWKHERVEVVGIDYKSKKYGSDNSVKMRMAKDSDIKKGDVLKLDERYYLVTWQIHDDKPNSNSCNIEMVPFELRFMRHMDAVLDNTTGAVVEAGGYRLITNNPLRCIMVLGGNMEMRLKTGQPGLFVEERYNIVTQLNADSKGIKINDAFEFFGETYTVRDVLFTDVNPDLTSGIITIVATRAAVGGVKNTGI